MSHSTGCPWWSRERLQDALERYGTPTAVAEEFGASEATVYRWINRHGLDDEKMNQ